MSRLAGKRYASYRDPFMGARLGKAVGKALEGVDYDLLLTNDFCIAGYTRIKEPVVLYTDDSFPEKFSENVHWKFENLSPVSKFFCRVTTRQGLRNADLCLFASQFAADSAVKYGYRDRYTVIPYGANILGPDVEIIRSVESIIQKSRLDLLFVGKDWEGKGGPIAADTVRLLKTKDINVHLHIVGVDSVLDVHEDYIHFYGLLNKDIEAEKAQLEGLYRTCDLLIVPSKAEGYGLAFVEAAAYGMPSLAYASTGIVTAVKHNKTGILLTPEKQPSDFADVLIDLLKTPNKCRTLSIGANEYYLCSANWKRSIEQLLSEIDSKLVFEMDEKTA